MQRPLNPKPGRTLNCNVIAEIDAALNRADTVEQAQEAFARVATDTEEVEHAVRVFRLWCSLGVKR